MAQLNYGYGFDAADYPAITRKGLENFLKANMRTNTQDKINDYLMDRYGSVEDVIKALDNDGPEEVFADYRNAFGTSCIYAVIAEIIAEKENIGLYVCKGSTGKIYLLYCPVFTWNMIKATEEEKRLSPRALEQIISKYMQQICADSELQVNCNYHHVP